MLLPKGLGADSPKTYITGERFVNGKKLPLTLAFNNPGGVKVGADWQGLVASPDGKHCAFSSAVFGFRALAMILRNYQKRHGVRTLIGVYERWAPSNSGEGNNPRDYAERVADRTGLGMHEELDLSDPVVLAKMSAAMCEVEAGRKNPFYRGDIEAGVAAALGIMRVQVIGESVEFAPLPEPKPVLKSKTLWGAVAASSGSVYALWEKVTAHFSPVQIGEFVTNKEPSYLFILILGVAIGGGLLAILSRIIDRKKVRVA